LLDLLPDQDLGEEIGTVHEVLFLLEKETLGVQGFLFFGPLARVFSND